MFIQIATHTRRPTGAAAYVRTHLRFVISAGAAAAADGRGRGSLMRVGGGRGADQWPAVTERTDRITRLSSHGRRGGPIDPTPSGGLSSRPRPGCREASSVAGV